MGLAFLYLPIVILVIYSFNASRLVTCGWLVAALYREFFNDGAMIEAAWMSFRVATTRPALRRCSDAGGGGAVAR